MDRCAECGFVYADHPAPAVTADVAGLGAAFRSRLSTVADSPEQQATFRRRPAPEVWSGLEYSCHACDVLLIQRERLLLALVEDIPAFPPMYRDQRVGLARYDASDLALVAEEIEVASRLLAHALSGLDSAGWSRRCIYSYPEPAERSLEWLAQQALHEGTHHLLDVDRAVARTSSA